MAPILANNLGGAPEVNQTNLITPPNSDPNAGAPAGAVIPGSNTPSAATPAPPAPTVASLYGQTGAGALDAASAAALAAKTAAYDPATMAANETQTRADVLKTFQSQLDSLDQAAAQARARITTEFAPVAAGRVGGATATEARRGLLGSDFGNAQTDTVNTANANELSSKISASDSQYDAQKNALMQFITGEADKEIVLRQDASSKGADAKIAEINDRQTRAQASALQSVKAMLIAGVSDSTNPNYSDSINQIASSTGLTKDAVVGLFNDTKTNQTAAAAAAKKAGETVLSPGQQLLDSSGKVIATVGPTDKFASVTQTDELGNQTVRIYDTTTGKFVNGAAGVSTPPSSTPSPTPKTTLPPAPGTAGTTGAGASAANPKVTFAQYGLLSKTDYNPDDVHDQLATLYLDKYIKSGDVPTASTMGRNIKPGLMALITNRAQDLYFKATGNPLPNPAIIKAQQDIIASNYKMGNNLAIQEQTVRNNVDLSLANMDKNGLNSTGFKPLDALLNNVKDALQDPNVGQMIAQNTTLQTELGSLLAVKNAGGTTVYDKLSSAGIISNDMSPDQIKQKVGALIQEAGNFAKALTGASGTAYGFTDPLLQDPNNPLRAQYTSGPANTTVMTGPDGQLYHVPNDKVDAFVAAGGKK